MSKPTTSTDVILAAAIVAVVIASLLAAPIGMMRAYNERLKLAFENGYEEGTVPGSQGTHWVKCKEAKK